MIRILIESNKGIRISGFKYGLIYTKERRLLPVLNVSISGNTNYYYYLRLVIKVQSQALLLLTDAVANMVMAKRMRIIRLST
jgi:hypothetical protein